MNDQQQMLELNVGTNFSLEQLEKYIDLNKRGFNVKISSVYGSLRDNVIEVRSARPNFRIGDTDIKTFEKFVRTAVDNGIEVEYAANATLFMSIEQYYAEKDNLIEQFKYLQSIGVKRLIVSNPLLMELISEHTELKIKASTILGINKPAALPYYAKYNVDNICPDIYINRNLLLLKQMQTEGQKHGIDIELLANEVCFYGNVPCNNMLRNACYQHSSMGGNQANLFSGWPFSRCQKERRDNPICWLKIPCILPQHIRKYAELTGIKKFKVSGRTNTTEYLFYIVEKYMSEQFEGDMEQLFMLPQNNTPAASGKFDVEKLTSIGHFDRWLNNKSGCDYNCHECRHCEKIYEQL